MIPVETKNERLKLELIIATGAPMAVANDAMEMIEVITNKTINYLPK